MKSLIVFSALIVSTVFLSSFTFKNVSGDPWNAPDKYMKMKNPVKADASSIAAGKVLYNKHCASCHGKKGLGDGTKAAQLDTHPGDFSKKAFTSQPDGSLFYKTLEGRGDMPSYKKKIPDEEDIWHVVNYMRTLAK
jgi:mono/diheme cytochrome c family protein